MIPRFALLVMLLFSGCVSPQQPQPQHTHIGDCLSCVAFILYQDQAHDGIQTQEIYGVITKQVPLMINREALLKQAAKAGAAAGAAAARASSSDKDSIK